MKTPIVSQLRKPPARVMRRLDATRAPRPLHLDIPSENNLRTQLQLPWVIGSRIGSAKRAPWYERAKLNLRLKKYKQARDDGERAANTRDPRGVIINLQLYALLEQIYTRLGDSARAEKYAKLSQ